VDVFLVKIKGTPSPHGHCHHLHPVCTISAKANQAGVWTKEVGTRHTADQEMEGCNLSRIWRPLPLDTVMFW
jgi:hypothetical protein